MRQNEASRLCMTNARARQNVLLAEVPTLQIPCIRKQHLKQAIVAFEKANAQLEYLHCQVCHQIRLDWKVVPITFDRKRIMCCNKCKNLKQVDMNNHQQWLPTWKDCNNNIHYEVPPQLAVLREREKLLI